MPSNSRAYNQAYNKANALSQLRYRHEHREEARIRTAIWRKNNIERARVASKKCGAASRARLRTAFLSEYGGKCVCCGETIPEFLTLEHTNRDGKIHRESIRGHVLRDLEKRGWPKEGYTILCMNCNFSTRYGKHCPHTKYKRN